MLWQTHIVIGAVAGALTAGENKGMFLAASISAVGALLPDIDTPNSKLGSKTVVSKGINSIFGHRGAMHSFVGCMFVLLFLRAIIPEKYLLYVGIGYVSHLFADMLNPIGVPLLWPIKKRFRIPLIKTGSDVERYILFPMLLILLGSVFLPMIVIYLSL